MVGGTKIVGLLFLVGGFFGLVFGDSLPSPPPSSIYMPVEDGCYSNPATIEYESITLNGKTFNRAVSPVQCLGQAKQDDANSFEDCAQKTIDQGYNSFSYITECSMYMFWVPRDNPLFSFDETNEYYSGSVQDASIVYISKDIITEDSEDNTLNPVVKPFIQDFSYSATERYDEINATVVLGGTSCLASVRMFEEGNILEENPASGTPPISFEYESPGTLHVYRKFDSKDTCATGDIYIFIASDPAATVPEDQKYYVRKTVTPSLTWLSDANPKKVNTILNLSGDLNFIKNLTIEFPNEDPQLLSPIQSEMSSSYTNAEADCKDQVVTVEIFDDKECSFSTTFDRNDLFDDFGDNIDEGAVKDTCAVLGLVHNNDEMSGSDGFTFCNDAGFSLPIIKTQQDRELMESMAFTGAFWLDYAKNADNSWTWSDESSTTLDTDIFSPIAIDSTHSCSYSQISISTLPLSSDDCGNTRVLVCWKKLPTE